MRDQEFYELRLIDPNVAHQTYKVRRAHARWEEAQQRVGWDGIDCEEFATLELARAGYERCRDQLVDVGFCSSDLNW